MEPYKVNLGQAVSLTTVSGIYRNVYESLILDVTPDYIEISIPIYKGLHVPLNVGMGLKLEIDTSKGKIEFVSKVLDRDVNTHSLLIKHPQDTYRIVTSEDTSRLCKFVTITSGKGGVGKTSFIINYAIALSKMGKKVVLIDADLGMANIDVLLKLFPKYNLIDVVEGSKTLKEIIVNGPGGIKVIPGGSGMQELAELNDVQLSRITTGFFYLSKTFDYVLIDTGAGLSKNIMSFIFSADETIVLTTPEPHAITDAYSILKVILTNGKNVNLKLVINKCETLEEGKAVSNKIVKVVKNFLDYNINPIGEVLESKVVSRAIRTQTPFLIAYPNSEPSRCIETIVAKEIGNQINYLNQEDNKVSKFITKFKILLTKYQQP